MDSYTVNVSSTDGQQLCGSQTTGGSTTSVVLDVTGCVMCQDANISYAITVEASNRGGQTTAITSMCKITSTCCYYLSGDPVISNPAENFFSIVSIVHLNLIIVINQY